MTRQEARARAVKMFGSEAFIRADRDLSSPERRAAALERSRALKASEDTAAAALEARRAELLSDPEYQRLLKEWRATKAQRAALSSEACYYKFRVGRADRLFAHVLGHGDTWEQAFDDAENKRR